MINPYSTPIESKPKLPNIDECRAMAKKALFQSLVRALIADSIGAVVIGWLFFEPFVLLMIWVGSATGILSFWWSVRGRTLMALNLMEEKYGGLLN